MNASSLRRRKPRRLALAVLLCVLLAATAVLAGLARLGVPPRLLGPYLQKRASGHTAVIENVGRLAADLLVWLDRGALLPRADWPAWLPPQPEAPVVAGHREVLVTDVPALRHALADARPGDVITLAPGKYRVEDPPLGAGRPGRADAPIVVRAARRGLATLQVDLLEGFIVEAPYWRFENLVIEGVCAEHDACEHAFHVMGAATAVEIRDNELRDFNAHIKINGDGRRFPDDGLIVGNRIYNTAPRRTANPVTTIDLVAASGWTVRGNLIADFVKADGDRTSYGAFAKGGGSSNRFEGNVVLCEHRLRGALGRRVGLSFGGGGSDARACRDGRCTHEHDLGLMRDNLVASCSDAGVYLNRAINTRMEHNTLLDTAGLQARQAGELLFMANLVDGPLRIDAASFLTERESRSTPVAALYLGWRPVGRLFRDAGELDLRWSGSPPALAAPHAATGDLCGSLTERRVAGAFEDIGRCEQAAVAAR